MIAALLVLAFTAPPNPDAAVYEAWRHRQAPTWVANAPAINADCLAGRSDTLARYWPTARAEAEWQFLGEFPASPFDAGQTITISVLDGPGWEYGVRVRDFAGNVSGWSNQVAR